MRRLVIAIILALVMVVGVCLPASAESSRVLNYTPSDILVYLNGAYAGGYNAVADGALVKDISVVCQGWGGKYKLDIPKGTSVKLIPNGARVYDSAVVRVYVSADVVQTASNCLLSGKPVTLYKLVGEEWVKLATIR